MVTAKGDPERVEQERRMGILRSLEKEFPTHTPIDRLRKLRDILDEEFADVARAWEARITPAPGSHAGAESKRRGEAAAASAAAAGAGAGAAR